MNILTKKNSRDVCRQIISEMPEVQPRDHDVTADRYVMADCCITHCFEIHNVAIIIDEGTASHLTNHKLQTISR